jgi:hypothetical protein
VFPSEVENMQLPDNPFVRDDSRFSRRDVLRLAGGAAAALLPGGLSASGTPKLQSAPAQSCIFLSLCGGPSQLDTWDPKPDAPREVRSPWGVVQTRIPGIVVGSGFPRMAARAHRFSMIRSLNYQGPAIHEVGQQLIHTGHRFAADDHYPAAGSIVAANTPPGRVAPYIVLPGPLGYLGNAVPHGQQSGPPGAAFQPVYVTGKMTPGNRFPKFGDSRDSRLSYGRHELGENCWRARQWVEAGARFVVVNMFDTVFRKVTWDVHANGGDLSTTLADCQKQVAPMFDQAYSALLDDLYERGLLDSTLVVAVGEFGRTPTLNQRGGRDHWTGVWTGLIAGGGVPGGLVVGSSDRTASEPVSRPVHPAELVATIYRQMGIGIPMTPQNSPRAADVDASPIHELVA